MQLRRVPLMILALQLVLAGVAFGQTYKVESAGAPPAALPKPLQDALEPSGTRVDNAQGAAFVELWLPRTVATAASPAASADILYGALSVGEFVGVVHFPGPAADFRGQPIKPGFYTVRYGLIPQDGNHMGVNPTRDAFVLCPVATDTNLDAPLKFEDLVKLSREASGTAHPLFLVGAPVNGSTFPSVFKDDQDHWDVQVKVHGSTGDVPIAITVVGKFEG